VRANHGLFLCGGPRPPGLKSTPDAPIDLPAHGTGCVGSVRPASISASPGIVTVTHSMESKDMHRNPLQMLPCETPEPVLSEKGEPLAVGTTVWSWRAHSFDVLGAQRCRVEKL
jgi:hypothetical protein